MSDIPTRPAPARSTTIVVPRLARRPALKRESVELCLDEQAGALTVRGRPTRRAAWHLLSRLHQPAEALGLPKTVIELAVTRWAGLPRRRASTLRLAPLAEQATRRHRQLVEQVECARRDPSPVLVNHVARWEGERSDAAAAAGLMVRFLSRGRTLVLSDEHLRAIDLAANLLRAAGDRDQALADRAQLGGRDPVALLDEVLAQSNDAAPAIGARAHRPACWSRRSTAVDLSQWRSTFADGWTDQDINSVLPALESRLGVRLLCVWDYRDRHGFGGPSTLIAVVDGEARELAGGLWELLVDGGGDGLISPHAVPGRLAQDIDRERVRAGESTAERNVALENRPRQDGRLRTGEPGSDPVTVRFRPQAWVRDHAVEVDPHGPVTFTVPAADARNGSDVWLEDCSYDSDRLREHPNAPAWIRDWQGPFEVEIEHP
jgi:hypothetical protein